MKIQKAPGEIKALVEELASLREMLKKAGKRETELTTSIKQFTDNEAASLMFNGQLIALVEEKESKRIDSDKLRANYPDVAAECMTASKYLTVKCC